MRSKRHYDGYYFVGYAAIMMIVLWDLLQLRWIECNECELKMNEKRKRKRRGCFGNFSFCFADPESSTCGPNCKSRKQLFFHSRDPASGKWWGWPFVYSFVIGNQTPNILRLQKTQTLSQIQTPSKNNFCPAIKYLCVILEVARDIDTPIIIIIYIYIYEATFVLINHEIVVAVRVN